MQHPFKYLMLLAFVAAGMAPASADPGKGEALHQQNCVSCHVSMVGGDGSELYTRETRRVGSFPSLVAQVNRCNVNLGVGWFDDEVEAVAEYLNAAFYRF